MAKSEGNQCVICAEENRITFQCCSKPEDTLCEECYTRIVSECIKRGRAVELLSTPVCPICGSPLDVEKLPDSVKQKLQNIVSTIPKTKTPQTVEDFGYFFDESGVLRHQETKEKFIYLTNRYYSLLGDCVETYIQNLIKSEKWNYREIWLPIREEETSDHHDQVNIFVSDDFSTNENGCLVLIQGSGAVRAGQWARSCCINDSLDIGAMFPYMAKAKENGLSVIIMNPNKTSYVDPDADDSQSDPTFEKNDENESTETDDIKSFYLSQKPFPWMKATKIPELSTSRDHVLYVYDNIIAKTCPAKQLYVVAHSAGGYGLMYLLRKRQADILAKLKNVAFTDSVHSISSVEPEAIVSFLKQQALHFVASDKPMGTPVDDDYNFSEQRACPEVSAGHNKHEYTSGHCVQGVFDFFFPPKSSADDSNFLPQSDRL